MAKKSKEVKFTKKEINSLQQLRSDYANVEVSLGKLEIARMQSEQQSDNIQNNKLRLETQYATLQRTESQIVSELTEKYGVGNLDITTGKFTPVS